MGSMGSKDGISSLSLKVPSHISGSSVKLASGEFVFGSREDSVENSMASLKILINSFNVARNH